MIRRMSERGQLFFDALAWKVAAKRRAYVTPAEIAQGTAYNDRQRPEAPWFVAECAQWGLLAQWRKSQQHWTVTAIPDRREG